MKTLLSAFAATAVALLFSSVAVAAPNCTSNFCKSGGGQCSLNGQTHTCGSCLGGTTHVLYVGALSSADADAACACQHDKTAPCSSAGQQVINTQPKDPKTPIRDAVKIKAKRAPVKAVAPR